LADPGNTIFPPPPTFAKFGYIPRRSDPPTPAGDVGYPPPFPQPAPPPGAGFCFPAVSDPAANAVGSPKEAHPAYNEAIVIDSSPRRSVLTRRLPLKLLAPTVLVSLLFLATCVAGAVFLNILHVNVSKVLTENVNSTLPARNLEAITAELVALLRGDHRDPDALAEQVRERNEVTGLRLRQAEELANLEQEQLLVDQIRAGFQDYLRAWERRGG